MLLLLIKTSPIEKQKEPGPHSNQYHSDMVNSPLDSVYLMQSHDLNMSLNTKSIISDTSKYFETT